MINVYITLSARQMNPDIEIISRASHQENVLKMQLAGASKVIDPYEISGRKVHELITRPMIVDMLEQTVFGRYIDIAQIQIPASSCLAGESLFSLELTNYNVILL